MQDGTAKLNKEERWNGLNAKWAYISQFKYRKLAD